MRNKKEKILLIIIVFILLIFGIVFLLLTRPNTTDTFNKNTYLVDENLGIKLDVSKINIIDSTNLIKQQFDDLDFILIQDNNIVDSLKYKDFNLITNITDEVIKAKEINDSYKGFDKLKSHNINLHINYEFNDKDIEKSLIDLNCVKNFKENKDAYLEIKNNEMIIVDEVYGTQIDIKKLVEIIKNNLKEFKYELDLDKNNVYVKPNILKNDTTLVETANKYNKCLNTVAIYVFGDKKEEVPKNLINSCLSLKDNQIVINDKEILSYIQELAKKYNTFGTKRSFVTTGGKTISIPAGDYGWAISQTKEANALKESILIGESFEREPIWLYKGYGSYFYKNGTDVNDSYVEIDISTQHLWVYVDGELKVETDFVSGNESNGCGTPSGVFGITYKTKNATLRGQGYSTSVAYWMPFNRGIGMHDATWRKTFGGNIYKNSGSHGCINLPLDKAKEIYSYMDTYFPIVVYDKNELF